MLFVGSNCECEKRVSEEQPSLRRTLSVNGKRALRDTAASSSSDDVVTANQAGNDQIIIWYF